MIFAWVRMVLSVVHRQLDVVSECEEEGTCVESCFRCDSPLCRMIMMGDVRGLLQGWLMMIFTITLWGFFWVGLCPIFITNCGLRIGVYVTWLTSNHLLHKVSMVFL